MAASEAGSSYSTGGSGETLRSHRAAHSPVRNLTSRFPDALPHATTWAQVHGRLEGSVLGLHLH